MTEHEILRNFLRWLAAQERSSYGTISYWVREYEERKR